MRVAVVCPYSMLRPGGVQEHVRGLAAGLVALGCEVTVFAPDAEHDRAPDGVLGVSLGWSVPIPGNGSVAPVGLDPRMLVRLELALDPADVIHAHEPFLPAGLAATLRAPKGTPVVGTFHAAADSSLPYSLAAPLLRRVARRLAATTAVSPQAHALVSRYVGLDPLVVPNGVDVASYETAEPDPWAVGLGRTVLFVGRPEPRKGFDVVKRAFAAAAEEVPDVHLVCLPAEPHDAADVPSRLRDRVHCLGFVPHERKLALYKAAEVACFPSRGGESFGIVVLEGLASGCAVLASDLPGYRTAGGGVPTYLPPGDVEAWRDGLTRLLTDPSPRRGYEEGPARARLFDWQVVAARTLEVYRSTATG